MQPQHVFFESDDEEQPATMDAAPSAAPAAHPATPPQAGGGPTIFRATSTVRTDFDLRDQCYVFDLAQSPLDAGSFAASCSNGRIKLYAVDGGGRVQHGGDLEGHKGTISGIAFPYAQEPHLLASSSYDGTVRSWDCRTRTQVACFDAPGHELYTFSCSSHVIAAGANGKVLFWDRRVGKAMGCFADTHAEEVTQVLFHPLHASVLVSGSVDGLVAVHDIAAGLDEDEGFKAALNIETSVARMGFYGSSLQDLWLTGSTESLHLWQWQEACSEEATGGSGALMAAGDARERLAATAAATQLPAGAALCEGAPRVDYLVACHWDDVSGRLMASAGSNEGGAALWPVGDTCSGEALAGAPAAVLPHGAHNTVVRSLLVLRGGTQSMLVTGGEDSRLCIWQQLQEGQLLAQPTSSAERRAMRRGPQHLKRKSPY